MNRPMWDSTWMSVAQLMKTRGTCPRAKVGAALASADNHLLSVGYNGAPTKMPHCTEEGCIIENGHCVRAVHAELNAILNLRMPSPGATLYTTHYPCTRCASALAQIGVVRVVYAANYRVDEEAMVPQLMETLGIELVNYQSLYGKETNGLPTAY